MKRDLRSHARLLQLHTWRLQHSVDSLRRLTPSNQGTSKAAGFLTPPWPATQSPCRIVALAIEIEGPKDWCRNMRIFHTARTTALCYWRARGHHGIFQSTRLRSLKRLLSNISGESVAILTWESPIRTSKEVFRIIWRGICCPLLSCYIM